MKKNIWYATVATYISFCVLTCAVTLCCATAEDKTNYADVDTDFDDAHNEDSNFEDALHTEIMGDVPGLPYCETNSGQDYDQPVIVVSSLDGRMTGIDAKTGSILWSLSTGGKNGSMLNTYLTKLEGTSRGEWVKWIPSLDGGIYKFNGESIEALPVTVEALLHSSLKLGSDTIFMGGKLMEVWGISALTGKVFYVCTAAGCRHEQNTVKPAHMLVVQRVTRIIRAVDPMTGMEKWNFSVGKHELSITGGGCEMPVSEIDDELPFLQFVVPDGIIQCTDETKGQVWQQKLLAPVVSAWRVHLHKIEEMDLFSSQRIPALSPSDSVDGINAATAPPPQPSLYIGMHENQLYIQVSRSMKRKVDSAMRFFITSPLLKETPFPMVNWRPYLATALSRTPVINYKGQPSKMTCEANGNDGDTNALSIRDVVYPFDDGYYLYEDQSSINLNSSEFWENETDQLDEEPPIMDDTSDPFFVLCFQMRWDWDIWLAIGIIIGCYVILHYLVIRCYVSRMRNRITQQAVRLVLESLGNLLQNNPYFAQIMMRLQRPALPLPENPEPSPININETIAPIIPVTPVTAPSLTENPSVASELTSFESRYKTDYEELNCLGRGGFGVVYHVRNKLDNNEYAVKRISLPLRKESADRVIREAQYLAKLDHPNIIRYYNSWLETPPPGWVEEEDRKWKQSEGSCMSSSMSQTQMSNTNSKVTASGIKATKKDFKYGKDVSESMDILFEDENESDPGIELCLESYLSEKVDLKMDHLLINDESNCDPLECDDVIRTSKGESMDPATDCPVTPGRNIVVDCSKGDKCRIEKPHRTYLYIQMELCKRKSLHDWLQRSNWLERQEQDYLERDDYLKRPEIRHKIYSVFNDIVRAVEYVHDKKLMHRDLKPSNIFFSLDDKIKIGDFGLAKSHITDDDVTDAADYSDNLNMQQHTDQVGTTLYMSPEQKNGGKSYDYKVDIYSLGLVFFEMLVRFETGMERSIVMHQVRNLQFPPDFADNFRDEINSFKKLLFSNMKMSLLQLMLAKDPEDRLTTKGIRARPPLLALQGDSVADISDDDHFRLSFTRSASSASSSSASS